MFKDRKDAAEQLAQVLEDYRKEKPLVLGIPRGGAETAYYVAKYLQAEMALVVTRKLGHPLNPEAAFGAIAEDGSLYISARSAQNIPEEQIKEILENQKVEVQRRILKIRKGKPLPPIKGRTVIIVDDGIATGATIFATIELCRKRKAAKIVVAAPIAGPEMDVILKQKVDDVIILIKPQAYSAVSQAYENFHNLSDKEANSFLEKWQEEHEPFDLG